MEFLVVAGAGHHPPRTALSALFDLLVISLNGKVISASYSLW